MCERALQFLLVWIFEAVAGWLHTVAVVLEQERPVAGVDGRRGGLWLNCVRVGVGLHESHCDGFSRDLVVALAVLQSSQLFGRREEFHRGPCPTASVSAKLAGRAVQWKRGTLDHSNTNC
jgi:hypothetical protein